MTLAFCTFLALFYLLPWDGGTLADWLWRHAPDHLPSLMVVRSGHLVCNGAFYAAILAAWALLLSLGAALSGGRGRTVSFRILAGLVGLPAFALVLVCLLLGKPVHGPLSLALTVLLTSLLPTDSQSLGKRRLTAGPDGSPSRPPGSELAPIPLSPDARPLTASEPPPLDLQAIAEKAQEARANQEARAKAAQLR